MPDTLSDDINDYCFIDTETKALPWTLGTIDADVSKVGAHRYSHCAVVIIITLAIGDGPGYRITVPDFNMANRLQWSDILQQFPELAAFYQRALDGKAWFVGWNMAFDRLMLNTIPGCALKIEMTIDCMGQASAANLPAKLEGASRAIGRHGKQQDGKQLIKLFTGADGWTYDGVTLAGPTPQSHPDEWRRFCAYASQDIDELRAVFKATRWLPVEDWRAYWANEHINDRGMQFDPDFAQRCADIAVLNARVNNRVLAELTDGAITAATQRERIANWLFDRTRYNTAADTLVKAWVDDDEVTGEERELVAAKLSVAEDRLLAYINALEALDEEQGLTDEEADLLDIAEARLFGASATPGKFQKALDYGDDDNRLRGQFRWNGAGQTTRYSSTGVQLHNLIRASLTDKEHPAREIDAIELINTLEV